MSKRQLPTINQPTLVTTLPLTGKKVRYRPFVIREQQAMLLAEESGDVDSIYSTIESVVGTCTGGDADLPKMPLGDLAWLFLQIHISSVGQEMMVTSTCTEETCKEQINIQVNLSDVKISELVPTRIDLTPTIGIEFRYPTYEDTLFLSKIEKNPAYGIYHLVESIWDDEGVFDKSDYTPEEFEEWFLSFNDKQVESVYNFVDKIPDIFLELNFRCPKCQKEYSKRVEGLQSFFRLSDGNVLN